MTVCGQPTASPPPPAARPHPAQVPSAPGPLLLDRLLPRYDLAVVHAQVFRAPPAACFEAARHLDLLRNPLIRTLLGLRNLPERLAERLPGHRDQARASVSPRTFCLEDMARQPINWTRLADEPGTELVLGQVGRPWQPTAMGRAPAVASAEFASFDQPGVAKIALSLSGTPRSTVVVRTRSAGQDYLVGLAGESEWVRNVRAAGGQAVLRATQPGPHAAASVILAALRAEHPARYPAAIPTHQPRLRPDHQRVRPANALGRAFPCSAAYCLRGTRCETVRKRLRGSIERVTEGNIIKLRVRY
jgi:hypothetical protein